MCRRVGAPDRLEYYHTATQLGAGAEALLGFVEAALKDGQGDSASVFAAASRWPCLLSI